MDPHLLKDGGSHDWTVEEQLLMLKTCLYGIKSCLLIQALESKAESITSLSGAAWEWDPENRKS